MGPRAPGRKPQTGVPSADECADEVLRNEVLLQKIRGRSLWSISRALKISEGRAQELLAEALEERRKHRFALADVLIELEVSRCDELTDAFWDTAMAPPAGALGENYAAQEKAGRLVLLAAERRSKLLGLDAPEKRLNEHSGPGGAPLPPQLLVLMSRADSGDESALAAIDVFAKTGAFPPGWDTPELVEGTADPAPQSEPAPSSAVPECPLVADLPDGAIEEAPAL